VVLVVAACYLYRPP